MSLNQRHSRSGTGWHSLSVTPTGATAMQTVAKMASLFCLRPEPDPEPFPCPWSPDRGTAPSTNKDFLRYLIQPQGAGQALGTAAEEERALPSCARERLHLGRFSVSRLTPRQREHSHIRRHRRSRTNRELRLKPSPSHPLLARAAIGVGSAHRSVERARVIVEAKAGRAKPAWRIRRSSRRLAGPP